MSAADVFLILAGVLGGLFVFALAFFSLLFGLYMYTRYMPEPFRSYLGVPSRERPVLFGGFRRRK